MVEKGETKPHIIIDNGTGYCKAGLSGEKIPKIVIPACVGYPKYASGRVGIDKKNYFVGSDAEAIKGVLNINNPIENGVVNNWDDIEIIWKYIFTNELKVEPVEYNVMLTETPMNPKENREKMTQIMFETFNVRGLYIAIEPVLSLYAIGKNTGVVADYGDHISYFVPIFYGCPLPHAVIRLNLGGKDITEYMKKLLTESGQEFSNAAEKEIIKTIKEKSCYIALDYEEELKNVEPFNFELPDGSNISIKEQRIKCPEVLFRPDMIGKEGSGIGKICYDSIQKCNIDIRKDLYNNIVLCGGTSMYNGFPKRFNKEIKNLVNDPLKEEVIIISTPERKYSTWIGGSILSNTSSDSMWITKSEYEEFGDLIVHRKCF